MTGIARSGRERSAAASSSGVLFFTLVIVLPIGRSRAVRMVAPDVVEAVAVLPARAHEGVISRGMSSDAGNRAAAKAKRSSPS